MHIGKDYLKGLRRELPGTVGKTTLFIKAIMEKSGQEENYVFDPAALVYLLPAQEEETAETKPQEEERAREYILREKETMQIYTQKEKSKEFVTQIIRESTLPSARELLREKSWKQQISVQLQTLLREYHELENRWEIKFLQQEAPEAWEIFREELQILEKDTELWQQTDSMGNEQLRTRIGERIERLLKIREVLETQEERLVLEQTAERLIPKMPPSVYTSEEIALVLQEMPEAGEKLNQIILRALEEQDNAEQETVLDNAKNNRVLHRILSELSEEERNTLKLELQQRVVHSVSQSEVSLEEEETQSRVEKIIQRVQKLYLEQLEVEERERQLFGVTRKEWLSESGRQKLSVEKLPELYSGEDAVLVLQEMPEAGEHLNQIILRALERQSDTEPEVDAVLGSQKNSQVIHRILSELSEEERAILKVELQQRVVRSVSQSEVSLEEEVQTQREETQNTIHKIQTQQEETQSTIHKIKNQREETQSTIHEIKNQREETQSTIHKIQTQQEETQNRIEKIIQKVQEVYLEQLEVEEREQLLFGVTRKEALSGSRRQELSVEKLPELYNGEDAVLVLQEMPEAEERLNQIMLKALERQSDTEPEADAVLGSQKNSQVIHRILSELSEEERDILKVELQQRTVHSREWITQNLVEEVQNRREKTQNLVKEIQNQREETQNRVEKTIQKVQNLYLEQLNREEREQLFFGIDRKELLQELSESKLLESKLSESKPSESRFSESKSSESKSSESMIQLARQLTLHREFQEKEPAEGEREVRWNVRENQILRLLQGETPGETMIFQQNRQTETVSEPAEITKIGRKEIAEQEFPDWEQLAQHPEIRELLEKRQAKESEAVEVKLQHYQNYTEKTERLQEAQQEQLRILDEKTRRQEEQIVQMEARQQEMLEQLSQTEPAEKKSEEKMLKKFQEQLRLEQRRRGLI